MSSIIRRYIDYMRFIAYMVVSLNTFFLYSFGSILYHLIHGCMFSMLLFHFVCVLIVVMYSYCYGVFLLYVNVFLLLCMFRSGYSVSLCCSVYCLCINV